MFEKETATKQRSRVQKALDDLVEDDKYGRDKGLRKGILMLVDYLLHWPQWLFTLLFITFIVLLITGVLPDASRGGSAP